ncbi:MAG: cytochrome d ubiquinol oxidase subunit II [Oceanipulchritudo sp.]
MDLNLIWFLLVGILFAGYAILDGFDLGVGMLQLFIRDDRDTRICYNAIGPVWDGNEVWLVTGGGALFAAFPEVYATVFSGFYTPFMLLLFALIFRAVAIEFRSKENWPFWRKGWDIGFFTGSFLASFLIGVTMGNIARGVPLDADFEYAGTFFTLLNPYALLMGLTTVALFLMHGSIYLVMKTEGDLHDRIRSWVNPLIIFFIISYAIVTLATLLYVEQITDILRQQPGFFALAILLLLAIANIPREISKGRDFRAFLSSCATMLLLMALFGIGMFPNMVYSIPDPANSLTAYNGASTGKTLGIMLIIAIIGIPIVLAYTVSIYWIFRGKVKLGPDSY